MIGWLIDIINPISAITNKIGDAYIAKQRVEGDTEKARIQANISALEKRRDVMIAEAGGSRWNTLVRAALAVPVVILAGKILVYDKALGQWTGGRTDALSPEIVQYCAAVVGFYFLYEVTNKITSTIKTRRP